ncbi:MAG: FGGY-family carbohydrate kinase [Granulosicoccus sp.]
MNDELLEHPENKCVVIGIDVGTGSARAGVFDLAGELLASKSTEFPLYTDSGLVVEQSSTEIWAAVCQSVKEAVAHAGVSSENVQGIGFDATCSLVIVAEDGSPLPTQQGGDPNKNVIVWMDHRSTQQAQRINATGHEVLSYVGGTISPEMQTPKLLWLKENNPDSYNRAAQFFDLTDFLSWKATGDNARSVCTLTCKWTYLAHEKRWSEDYFRTIGLADLADDAFARIGERVVDTGCPLGSGLSAAASVDLGLKPGTPVAAGLIDAHAGGVGTIGAAGKQGTLESRMAYIFGTSACSMASTRKPAFVKGVWGPYYSAMLPGYWLNEGGQSAAGAAVDHLVQMHPASGDVEKEAAGKNLSLLDYLQQKAESIQHSGKSLHEQMGRIQVLPEFLGNRSPHADPESRAVLVGLGLDKGEESLVGLYLAGLCGLGYGVRQLSESLCSEGVEIDTLVISGGAGQSDFVRQLFADATGLTIAAPESSEPVLLGAAILGAVAGQGHEDLAQAMEAMSRFGRTYQPSTGDDAKLHTQRYKAFSMMQELDRQLRDLPAE